jgi:hypothetical protein
MYRYSASMSAVLDIKSKGNIKHLGIGTGPGDIVAPLTEKIGKRGKKN